MDETRQSEAQTTPPTVIDEKRAKMLAHLERARELKRQKEAERRSRGEAARVGCKMKKDLEKELNRPQITIVNSGQLTPENKQVVEQFLKEENVKVARLKEQGATERDFDRFYQRQEQLLSQLVNEIVEIKNMKKEKRQGSSKPKSPKKLQEESPKSPPKAKLDPPVKPSSFTDLYA